MRKTIPTEKLLNWLAAESVSHRKTAQNLRDDGRDDLAKSWDRTARQNELVLNHVLAYAHGDNIFDYVETDSATDKMLADRYEELQDFYPESVKRFKYPVPKQHRC